MPVRRGMGGLSSGAGGNLFDRPGFFDYAEVDNLTLNADLLLKTASETYGIYLGHGDTSGASQHYTATIPALSADGEMVITTATQTLTNKTYVNPVLTTILDANGNEQLILAPVSSAVNYLQITNSATSNPPILKALGTDTNIDLRLEPKGSGKVVITSDVDIQGTSTTVNSTTLDVDDKNITMGSVGTPTNTTANGGGITLKGATDKTIIWDSSNTNWTSSEHWNIASGKEFKINNASTLTATTLGSAVVNSSLTTVGTLASGAISSAFGAIDIGTSVLTAGQLNIDNIRIDGNTISSTSGELILDAVSGLNFSDDAILNIGNLAIDSLTGDNNAIQIGDNSDDAVSIYRVTALTAMGNLDIGAHGFRANTLTADGLTETHVLYAGANGLISGEAGFTYDAGGNSLQVPTIVATNINAFTLGGKLTAGSNEIEGSAFDINGGNIDATTLGAASAVTINGASIGTGLTWGAAQNFGNYALTNVNIDSGTVNLITSFGIKQSATAYEVQLAAGSTALTANRAVSIDPKNAARTLTIGGDLTLSGAFTTSGDDAITLTTSNTTNVTLPTTGTLATIAGNETLTNKTLTTPAISTISNSGTVTLPTGNRTLVGRDTTDTLTNKTINASNNTVTNIANSSLSNSAITIGGTSTSLGGTITALTALTDLDLTAGNKTIFDTVGSNTLTLGGSGTTINIAGDLTVQGTTTTTNTESQTVDDPIFQLGGESAPSNDDNKDRGIAFRWHTGSAAKNGFFGYDDSTGKFTFIPDATINNEVVSGTAGTITATTFEGALSGNATTATSAATWTTARTLSFTGDVTGSGSVNGGSDVATALTIASNAVQAAMVHEDTVSGRTELTNGNVDTANDFMLVWDATDSTLKKAKPGSLGISGQAVGSGTELQYNSSNNFAAAANVQIKNAALALKEMSAPNATSGFGSLYAKTDNELYYKDDGGNETKITSAGSLAGGGAFKGIKAYSSGANLSIANDTNSGAGTTVTAWTEVYDVGAFHDGSTNTDRFTFGQTGYFLITIQHEWAVDSAGYREMAVTYRDTSGSSNNVILRDRILATSNQATAISGGSTLVYVDDVADYVTVQLYQNSGAALNAIGNNDDSTFITITRLDMATSASGSSSGTAGHIQFSDGSGAFSSDNNAIFWDATNNRLGVNTGSPAYSIDTTASGTVRAATFTGNLTGNVTGNTSGTAATVTGAAQTAITSLGTLTALTVDNVVIDGTNIGHTSDTDLLALGNATLTINGATTINQHLTVGATNTGNNRFLTFLTDDGYASGIVMGNNSDADRAWLKYYGGDDSPADQMELKVTGSAHSRYQVASNVATVAFQASSGAKLSTTAGDLVLDPAGNVTLADNDKIVLGTGSDLEIYHSGNDSYIADTGTGALIVKTNILSIRNAADNAQLIYAGEGNQVDLYHNGSKKFETTSTGVTVTGNVNLADNGQAIFGTGSDFKIYHDGTANIIDGGGTADIKIQDSSHTSAIFDTSAEVQLWYDNSKKFETTAAGATITGGSNLSGGGVVTLKIDNTTTGTFSNTGIGDYSAIDFAGADASGDWSGGETRARVSHMIENSYGSHNSLGFYTSQADAALVLAMKITHEQDIRFYGANYHAVWDRSANRLEFADGAGITLGTGDDWGMYHSSNTNQISVTSKLLTTGTLAGHYDGGVVHQQFFTGNSNSGSGFVVIPTFQGATSDSSHQFAQRIRYTFNASGSTQSAARGLYIEPPVVTAGTLVSNYGLWVDAGTAATTNNYAAYLNGKVKIVENTSGTWLDIGPETIDGTTREGGIKLHVTGGSSDRSWGIWGDANNPRALRFEYLGARGTGFGSGTAAITADYRGMVGIGSDATTPAVALEVDHGGNVDSIVRVQYDDANYLQITPRTLQMQMADTSTSDFTISTTNAGTWGSGGGDIILMPGGIAGGNYGDVGVGTAPYHLNNYRFLHIHHDTNGGGMVMSDNSNRRAAIYNGDANLYVDVTSTGHIAFRFNGTAPGGTEEFRMEADGDFHADGDVYAFSTTVGSDIALKENINVIDNALDKVSQLKGVSFDWKRKDKGSSVGLIAQDVEKVLPELVKETTALGGNDSHKNLNYNGIIGLLVESIKELKDELRELKNASSK